MFTYENANKFGVDFVYRRGLENLVTMDEDGTVVVWELPAPSEEVLKEYMDAVICRDGVWDIWDPDYNSANCRVLISKADPNIPDFKYCKLRLQ
jgi:hypothetical protein